MPNDPLMALAGLPNVADALEAARRSVDSLLWDRAARRRGRALATESTVAGAWCNSAFEGAEVGREALRRGSVEDSPMGRVAAGTLVMYREIPSLAETVLSAPLQALARMHLLTVTGEDSDAVGRPRTTGWPEDPLRTRLAVPPQEVGPRLAALAGLLSVESDAPALLVAAIAHAELAVVQPFHRGSGLVARAITRVIIRARGVDPDGWAIPEAGLRQIGRPKYVAALRAYSGGEPDGVRRWLLLHADAVARGAAAARETVPGLPED